MKNQEIKAKILEGLKLTYSKLIEFKKQKKTRLVIQRGDEIIKINPENL